MEFINIIILLISATLIALTIIIFIKSRKYQTNVKFLLASLLSIAIANTGVGLNIENLIFMLIIVNLLPLGILFLFFHYEGIAQPRPRLSILISLLIIFTLMISFRLIIPIYISFNEDLFDFTFSDLRIQRNMFIYTIFRISDFFLSLIIFTVFVLAFFTVIKDLKTIKLKAILIESIGLVFLIMYGFLYLIRDLFFYEYHELLTSFALIASLIGLFLIISNFIIHPDYLYLLPFPIFSFLIFNESGISCYVRKVDEINQQDKQTKDLDLLMAGAFTAISNMFKEVLGVGAEIRYIDADQFKILVTSLPQKKGVLVVISRGVTALFKSSLLRFSRTWTPELLKEINDLGDLNELRPKVDELIRSSFPYVNFSKSE